MAKTQIQQQERVLGNNGTKMAILMTTIYGQRNRDNGYSRYRYL